MIDDNFLSELRERLFVLYLGGRWMAPLSARLMPAPGMQTACLACADAPDVARALAGLRGGPVEDGALAEAYRAAAPRLRALRRLEGTEDPVAAPEAVELPGEGPLLLLSAAGVPLARLAGLLRAGAKRGLVWKPAPAAAASAHVLVQALAPVLGARVALLQGDHATGAAMAAQGPVIWASDAAPPRGVSVRLTVPARSPHRR